MLIYNPSLVIYSQTFLILLTTIQLQSSRSSMLQEGGLGGLHLNRLVVDGGFCLLRHFSSRQTALDVD